MPETEAKASAETVTFGQWGYAIERRWYPGKSKPLMIGFARVLASNYDSRRGYICVSYDKLAEQCDMHRRATEDLFKRVVREHKLFRVVGSQVTSKGGRGIPKLVWQLPPENMRPAGAGNVPMPELAPTREIPHADNPWADESLIPESPTRGILHTDDAPPQVSEDPNTRNSAHNLFRDYLCAPDQTGADEHSDSESFAEPNGSAQDGVSKIVTDLNNPRPRQSEATASRLTQPSASLAVAHTATTRDRYRDDDEWTCPEGNGCTAYHIRGLCPAA